MVQAESNEGNVSPSSFFLYDLVKRARESVTGVLNHSIQLPDNVKNEDVFSKYLDEPQTPQLLSWGQWGISDEEDNSGGHGTSTKPVYMPTIKTEKDGYVIHLGIMGVSSKELYYHVEPIKAK